jgi:hypothetical protein
MTRRKVTHTRKNNGRVVALGNLEEWWHPRQAIDAIVDIDAKVHRYYIVDRESRVVPIRALLGPYGPRLGAPSRDGVDLLTELPDC